MPGAARPGRVRAAILALFGVCAIVAGMIVAPSVAPLMAAKPDRGQPDLPPVYLDITDLVPKIKFDAHGVAVIDYDAPIGRQYNPTMVAQAAFGFYGRYLESKDPAELEKFYIQTDWLVRNQTADGRWLYHFAWGDQPVPWWSAMAQGQAMSALVRAYVLSGDTRYRTAVERARTRFDMVVARGGVASWMRVGSSDYVVYEEVLGTYCPRVLNGWIFGLIGLYEDWLYLHDPAAEFNLYAPDRGFAALKALLPYYDTGSWSYYNLDSLTASPRGRLATNNYQHVHVVELRYLYAITGDPIYKKYADLFLQYAKDRGIQI
jgi:hypothetical protein